MLKGVREYFFEINRHGQLFNSETKHKNFTTQIKLVKFLDFFYKNISLNSTGKYPDYKYMSVCMNEVNYIKSEYPIVFQSFQHGKLFYGGSLKMDFDPKKLYVKDGLFLHEFKKNDCEFGLLKDQLVIDNFYNSLQGDSLIYEGQLHKLKFIN